MALIKQIQTAFGVVTPYNRIERVEMGANRKVLIISVAQYYNEVIANTPDGRALNYEHVSIPMDRIEGDIRDLLYPLIQQYYLSPFAEAQSDIPPDYEPCTSLSIKPEWVFPGPPEEQTPSDLPPESVPLPEGFAPGPVESPNQIGPSPFQPNTAWPEGQEPQST